MELILASGSPRRHEVLRTLGFRPGVDQPEVDESTLPGEAPHVHVERLAREKALTVADRHLHAWVVAGDTVVTDGVGILGKPRDEEDALRILLRLRGRTHEVASGLALVAPLGTGSGGPSEPDSPVRRPSRPVFSGVEVTRVHFRPFSREEAESYVRTGEPLDKAGAYGIQGMGAALVDRIEGDYTGVVGLPVPLLLRLLAAAGRPYRFGADHRLPPELSWPYG